jgi:hypothetical protein
MSFPLRLLGPASAIWLFVCCASAKPHPAPQPASAPPPVAAAPTAETAPEQLSGIRFSVAPPDAQVFINGRSVGKVAELKGSGTVRLSPGLYRVSVERVGFQTWRAEVAVRGGVEPIEVKLLQLQP